MNPMNKPPFDVVEVIQKCTQTMYKKNKERYSLSINYFKCYSYAFDILMQKNEAFKLRTDYTIKYISKDDAEKLYSDKMRDHDLIRPYFYDILVNSAPDGICPICSQEIADTIDHYMPQSIYPYLAVTPINLIPVCLKCNRDKWDKKPEKSSELTLHPYYDDFQNRMWLKSKVTSIKNNDICFYVDEHDTDKERLKNHLSTFHFYDRFKVFSMSELHSRRREFMNHYTKFGYEALMEHLNDGFLSAQEYDMNYWKTALYYGLINASEDVYKEWFDL